MSVNKVVGSDKELGVTYIGRQQSSSSPATLIQREVTGARRSSQSSSDSSWQRYTSGYGDSPANYYGGYNQQDHSGAFRNNGSCHYIDLNHPEICTPECNSAIEFVKYTHACINLAQQAADAANGKLNHDGRGDGKIILFNDNTDRSGHSYGSHLNIQLSAETFNDTFYDVMFPHLSFLGSFQASSILLSGGGKVGAETSDDTVEYQISRRSEFIETFLGSQTTYNRPLINSRNEALGNTGRLHVIFADSTLLHYSNYLAAGSLQLTCSMMEAGIRYMNTKLCLEKPVDALREWSRDPDLRKKMRMLDGRMLTAAEHQLSFIDEVGDFISSGQCQDVIEASRILEDWHATIEMLRQRNFDRAGQRLEWLCKQQFLQDQVSQHGHLNWQSPELKQLDLMFSILDPKIGFYWRLEESGMVEKLVSESEIEFCETHPPEDTRAWLRGNLIRTCDSVVSANWDRISIQRPERRHTIKLPDVSAFTCADFPLADFADSEALVDQLIKSTEGEYNETGKPIHKSRHKNWHSPAGGAGANFTH